MSIVTSTPPVISPPAATTPTPTDASAPTSTPTPTPTSTPSVPAEEAEQVDIAAIFAAQQPFRPLVQGETSTIPIRLLNAEITCAICLGIIRNCTAVMECLHRFCSACIEKSLRFGKKQCPQCRVSCPSRRNLRPDPAFDAIICSIYPDLTQAEEQQDSLVQQIIQTYNPKAFAQSALKSARRQQDKSRARTTPKRAAEAYSYANKRPKFSSKPDSICFSLVQHPSLEQSIHCQRFKLNKSQLKTSRYVTMILIKKFLSLKIAPPKSVAFLLYTKKLLPVPEEFAVASNQEFIPLAADTTLDEIEHELCPEGSKVILYYSVMALPEKVDNYQEQLQQTTQKTGTTINDS